MADAIVIAGAATLGQSPSAVSAMFIASNTPRNRQAVRRFRSVPRLHDDLVSQCMRVVA